MTDKDFYIQIFKEIKTLNPVNLLLLTVVGIINAIGVTMFLPPVKLYDSGISGTSMLLLQLTPENFTLSVFLVLLNIPLFLYGLKKQGGLFTFYAIYTVLFIPSRLGLLQIFYQLM